MSIYLKVELADPRYCDGCPCLDYDADHCTAFDIDLGSETRWLGAGHESDTNEPHWLRPQACKDASALIDRLAVNGALAEDAEREAAFIGEATK